MIVIGIDPGKTGAVAAITPDSTGAVAYCECHDMPVITEKRGKGRRRHLDETALHNILLGHVIGAQKPFVYVEQCQPFPKQGGVSNFSTGYQFGVIKGLLCAMKIPFEVVTPKEWQGHFFKGMGKDTKANSYQVASRLFFMDVELKSPRGVIKDGRCDALLIAEWGRRRINGAQTGKGV